MAQLAANPALSVERFGFFTSALFFPHDLSLELPVWARYDHLRSQEELLPSILMTVGEHWSRIWSQIGSRI